MIYESIFRLKWVFKTDGAMNNLLVFLSRNLLCSIMAYWASTNCLEHKHISIIWSGRWLIWWWHFFTNTMIVFLSLQPFFFSSPFFSSLCVESKSLRSNINALKSITKCKEIYWICRDHVTNAYRDRGDHLDIELTKII